MARFKYIYSNISPRSLSGREVEYSNVDYEDPKTYSFISRYKNIYRIIDENNGCDFHSNYFNFYIPTSDDDQFVKYTGDGKCRLDSLAMKYYGSSLWWWVIASANSIIDPLDIEAGTILRIPPIESIYSKGSVFY